MNRSAISELAGGGASVVCYPGAVHVTGGISGGAAREEIYCIPVFCIWSGNMAATPLGGKQRMEDNVLPDQVSLNK